MAAKNLTGISATQDQKGSSAHPGQWCNNPEYTEATTKMRPCSCIEAYAHYPAGLELVHGEHMLRNPECDVWGENVVRYKG